MREFYGSIRGRLSDIDPAAKRALLQPIGCNYFVKVIGLPPSFDTTNAGGEFVEIAGMVGKNENDYYTHVITEHVRPLVESDITWGDLHGYLPEITGGLPLDEYLATLAEGWQ